MFPQTRAWRQLEAALVQGQVSGAQVTAVGTWATPWAGSTVAAEPRVPRQGRWPGSRVGGEGKSVHGVAQQSLGGPGRGGDTKVKWTGGTGPRGDGT